MITWKPEYVEKSLEIYTDIAKNVETRSDTLTYALDRPLPKRKNEKVTVLMKDEIGRKIMTLL